MSKNFGIGVAVIAVLALIVAIVGQVQTQNSVDRLVETVKASNESRQGGGDVDAEKVAELVRDQMKEEERLKRKRAYDKVASKFEAAEKGVSEEHIYGNPDADFSIVEFTDYECPYCKRFHSTPKSIVDSVSDGQVNWVVRHFPLSMHGEQARLAARAGECVADHVGNRAFWVYTQMYFDNQKSSSEGKTREMALKTGIGEEKLDSCLSNPETQKAVQEDFEFGRNAGISGTPAVFIIHHDSGTVRQMSGAVPAQRIKQTISSMQQSISGKSSSAGS